MGTRAHSFPMAGGNYCEAMYTSVSGPIDCRSSSNAADVPEPCARYGRRASLLSVLVLLAGIATGAGADVSTVRYKGPEDADDRRQEYFIDLLGQVMERTRDGFGDYRLEQVQRHMFQARALRYLEQGRLIDVVWTMTSVERERQVLPVRVPLFRGLLGYRIFIIRESEQARFDAIDSLASLAGMIGVQGHDWPDLDILRHNGLNIMSAPTYGEIFELLAKGRYDYFPRGVTEAFQELATHANLPIAVEQSILVYYPTAMYFFVSRANGALATRLGAGLRAMVADGSLDRFLRSHPNTRAAFETGSLENRRRFDLENPLLPAATPLDEEALWYQPEAGLVHGCPSGGPDASHRKADPQHREHDCGTRGEIPEGGGQQPERVTARANR